jgi:hypothetical protein
MTSKKDFTQVAYAVFQQAVGEVPKKAPSPKQEAGRKGGLKGGAKRMTDLTPEQRKELALKAANARWGKSGNAPGPQPGARKR